MENKINSDFDLTKHRLNELAMTSFKLNRINLRFMKTMAKFAKSTGHEAELMTAYFETILE